MADRLIAAGRYAEADRWIAKALAGNPTPGPAEFRIGRALLARGRAEAALPHLWEAARIDAAQPETSFALGQALLDAGRPGDAIPHLRRALKAGVRPDIAGFDLARALGSTGDRSGAIRVLRDVRPARADDASSWEGLGELAEELSDPALAASFYSRAADAAPQRADPRERYGVMLAITGDLEEAVRQLERAVAVDARDASARLNLAVAYSRVGRYTDARTQAMESLRLDPSYEKAKNLLSALPK
jgi:tetratricopeptide (TPR) repeat protein